MGFSMNFEKHSKLLVDMDVKSCVRFKTFEGNTRVHLYIYDFRTSLPAPRNCLSKRTTSEFSVCPTTVPLRPKGTNSHCWLFTFITLLPILNVATSREFEDEWGTVW